MEQPNQESRTEVYRLPIVCVDGERYFIDQRLREFRTVTPPMRVIEFIPFDSQRGRRFLDHTVMIPCGVCGVPQIQPKRTIPPDNACFDCAERW